MYKSDQQYETRIKLVEKALKQNRSKTEIQENLRDAGIIDKNRDDHARNFSFLFKNGEWV